MFCFVLFLHELLSCKILSATAFPSSLSVIALPGEMSNRGELKARAAVPCLWFSLVLPSPNCSRRPLGAVCLLRLPQVTSPHWWLGKLGLLVSGKAGYLSQPSPSSGRAALAGASCFPKATLRRNPPVNKRRRWVLFLLNGWFLLSEGIPQSPQIPHLVVRSHKSHLPSRNTASC